eukprot:Nk52_evm3s2011 gene=Nk52_evmTU3s2011
MGAKRVKTSRITKFYFRFCFFCTFLLFQFLSFPSVALARPHSHSVKYDDELFGTRTRAERIGDGFEFYILQISVTSFTCDRWKNPFVSASGTQAEDVLGDGTIAYEFRDGKVTSATIQQIVSSETSAPHVLSDQPIDNLEDLHWVGYEFPERVKLPPVAENNVGKFTMEFHGTQIVTECSRPNCPPSTSNDVSVPFSIAFTIPTMTQNALLTGRIPFTITGQQDSRQFGTCKIQVLFDAFWTCSYNQKTVKDMFGHLSPGCASAKSTSPYSTSSLASAVTTTVMTTKEPESTTSAVTTTVMTTKEPAPTTSAVTTTVMTTREPQPTPSAVTTTVMTTKEPQPTTSSVIPTSKANAPNHGQGCKSSPLGAISGNDILNPAQGKDILENDSLNPQFYDDYSIRAKFLKSNIGGGKTVTYDISNIAWVGCVEIVYYVYVAGDLSLKVDNHQSSITNFGYQPTVANWRRKTEYYDGRGESMRSLSITVKTPSWADWTVQLAQISLFVGHTIIPPNFNLGCHLTMLSSISGNALLAPQKGSKNVAKDQLNPSFYDNYSLRVKFPTSTSAKGASVTYVVPLFPPSEDASCVEIVYYVFKGDGEMFFSVNDDTNHIDTVPFGDSNSQAGWERKTVYYKVPLNAASIKSLSLNVKAKYVDLGWGVQLAAVTFFGSS